MPIHLNFSTAQAPDALAIFCRAPRLGTVKTRLAASRGDEFALGLYRAMLADSFALGLALAPRVETFAFFTPNDALADNDLSDESLSSLWSGNAVAQCQGDLGTKMLDCFAHLRRMGFEKIVLIGSDSPDVPLSHLQGAFERLAHSQLVVGPSDDGGFYLIGASAVLPDTLFESIVWSSAGVYERLRGNLGKMGKSFKCSALPSWRDVDEEGDLKELERRIFESGTHAPHTRAFLEKNRPGNRA
jgi:rSAM/selenodomain-associated transferase 1